MSTPPDFATLSESEKRVVAERMLKIKESGWVPFWCPVSTCPGEPHLLPRPLGDPTFVEDTTVSTDTQPVGNYYNDLRDNSMHVLAPTDVQPYHTLVGRVRLDPNWAHNHARVDQRLPPWNEPWTLFIMSGRGSGKTRTGIEFVTLCARKGLDGAIVGRRGTELENTHVAELIKYAHPEFVPTYLSSKDILVWPNGATTYLFSAERPENIRSVNLSYCWFDEAAWMDEIEKAWPNAKFATRVKDPKNPIHFLITSTPTATPWTMKMEEDPDVQVRRVSTYANRANLSRDFLNDLNKEYEGTRLGRQEIHGEVLRDVVGALWNDDIIHGEHMEPEALEQFLDLLDDRVLAVDPAGSKGKTSDATGIIAAGVARGEGEKFYVLGDATLKGSPTEWAAQVFKAARFYKVNRIIVERNFGADMVRQTLTDYATNHPEETCDEDGDRYRIVEVRASESKETRAEPTVGKYEQGRVTHIISPRTVFGDLSMLEKEQTMWVPKSRGGKSPSPNRVDALVWAIRALETNVKFESSTAAGNLVSDFLGNNRASHRPGVQIPTVSRERKVQIDPSGPPQAPTVRQEAPKRTFPVRKPGLPRISRR